jgi:DNA polymerase-1
MSRRWLILDVSFLCWRLFHTSLKKLSHNEIPTGVMFGFVRDFVTFQDVHSTTNIAFCFDSRDLKRKEALPTYKSSRELKRQQETPEERKSRQGLMDQIVRMRQSLLPAIGFRNIFYADGFEADDVIASLCKHKHEDDEYIVISSDKDLLQLLTPSVSIWDPKTQLFTTPETFEGAWGIPPRLWPYVKAIAGCNTDDIPGIPSIGEKKAASFLARTMNKKTPTYQLIKSSKEIARSNFPLVKLPFKGTPVFQLKPDKIDPKVWESTLREYGMYSLRSCPPTLKRRGMHDG